MRIQVLLLAAVLGAASPPLVAVGHPGHDHKLMGTIVSVEGARVLIRTTDGKDRSFKVVAVTKVLNGKAKSDARELKAGMRVVVNVGNGEEPLTAKEVQYSVVTAAKQK